MVKRMATDEAEQNRLAADDEEDEQSKPYAAGAIYNNT
jgi:hypothetical protein